MVTTKSIFISDTEQPIVDNHNDVIYWSSYTNSEVDGIFSLPLLVEKNADNLKSQYLALIYEFGKAKIRDKQIVEHLKIRPNFSYWWMTLLVEKCNYSKSPQISNVIKLIGLREWLKENKYEGIYLITDNKELLDAISLLSKELLIDFEWIKEKEVKPKSGRVKQVFSVLPNIIQQPIWLLYYILSNWSLKGVGVKEWRETTATTTFVSYLFNNIPELVKQGHYGSYYWTDFVDLLNKKQHSTNWLHFYVKDNLLPTAKNARKAINEFNKSKNSNQCHVTLASFLSISLIYYVLKDSYKIARLAKTISFQIKIKSGYLWPLIKQDFEDSMKGISAISNILYFNLFEKAMNELPPQKKGCYLQENQGWEFGFISTWKSAGHENNIIGYPHSTVRYWDLRYFFDPRSYERKDESDLPLPSYVGVNGSDAKKMYINGSYPPNKLIKLEALRYLHIHDSIINRNKRDDNVLKEKVVLVVGDYLKKITDLQLDILSSALVDINQSTHYIIKPHPGCPINMEDYPELSGELSKKPIQELLAISDVIYSGPTTSAVVDAYCVGLPVVTLLDGKALNLSPLKDNKGVYFVTNSKELAAAINNAKATNSDQGKNYFYLHTGLPRWHEWLINDIKKS